MSNNNTNQDFLINGDSWGLCLWNFSPKACTTLTITWASPVKGNSLNNKDKY